jgi:predicted NACHT family NTPase
VGRTDRARRKRRSRPCDALEIKDVLAVAVRTQWEIEAALRAARRPPMRIHWRVTTRDGVQAHPDTIARKPLLLLDAASDDLDEFVEDFRRLRAQRVVLLGGPGTGKTTLAVRFLLNFLAGGSPDDPVPVLLSAASWDTTQHPALRDWLTERLPADLPRAALPDLGTDAAMVLADHQDRLVAKYPVSRRGTLVRGEQAEGVGALDGGEAI